MAWWVGVLVSALLIGCGPKVGSGSEADGTGTGGADDGVDDGVDDGLDDGLDDGVDDGADDGEGSGGEPTCEEVFGAEDGLEPVRFTIRNATAAPVYVRPVNCAGSIPIELELFTGAPVQLFLDDCFPQRCDEFLGATDCLLGCPDCGSPWMGRFEPGAIGTLDWDGAALRPRQMTAECAPGEQCQRECFRKERPVPAGQPSEPVLASLQVFRACTGACECDAPQPGMMCTGFEMAELSDPFTIGAEAISPMTELVIE